MFAATLLCCALLLAACAAKPADEQPEPEQPAVTEQSAPPQSDEPVRAERPEVENNGGTFVRVGEQVWFRYYDEGTIDETQLWGNFLAVWPSHAVSSTLCYYDVNGDAVNEAFSDDGFGPLWFGVDGFYLSRSADGGQREAYFKALDGAETVLQGGYVAGVSDNGRFAVVFSEGESDEGSLCVYEGTEKLRFVPYEDHYQEFCAVTDDGALLYLDRGSDHLCELKADGTTTVLGALSAPEDYGGFGYAWELEQCLVNGDEVWCAFGSYEGTGHFLSDVLCVRAQRGAENSLEAVEDQPTTEYPFVPKLYVGADGEVCRAEHEPGEVGLNDGLRGDLVLYEDAAERVIALNFLRSNIYNDEGYGKSVQTMETIGDAAYLIVADAFRDEANDVGWRMAFAPGEFYYLRVPFSGSGVETLYGAEWDAAYADYPDGDTAAPLEEVYPDFVGTWRLFATEVEGDRSDVLPDGMVETVKFYADETRAVIDSFDGEESYYNDFDHAETLPTGGASEDMSPCGLLFTGGENDDMLWAYFEGDTLVVTVMMHFDTEYGTDSVSRTGFYVREAS